MFDRAGLRSVPFRQSLIVVTGPFRRRRGRSRASRLISEIDRASLDQSHRVLLQACSYPKTGLHPRVKSEGLLFGIMPQPDFDFSIAVVNGTSRMPWLSRALVQTPSRSIEIGSAEAMPTAAPRSFARFSSLARARSISTGVGTASML